MIIGVFPMTHHVECVGNGMGEGRPACSCDAILRLALERPAVYVGRDAAPIPKVFGQNTA